VPASLEKLGTLRSRSLSAEGTFYVQVSTVCSHDFRIVTGELSKAWPHALRRDSGRAFTSTPLPIDSRHARPAKNLGRRTNVWYRPAR
jgi:hypothetical protein